jgi:acyl-CoA dehydrogenase
MYMMSATLRRFREDGSLKEDEVLLRVAIESGFNKIDEAFMGIYANLSTGFLSWIFNIKRFFVKINPMGDSIKDADLHTIARQMREQSHFRERVCANIYHGKRINTLMNAAEAMLEAQSAFAKVKTSGYESLGQEEKTLFEKAKTLQEEVVAVDSFTQEEYEKC